jgi:hypothetical protein
LVFGKIRFRIKIPKIKNEIIYETKNPYEADFKVGKIKKKIIGMNFKIERKISRYIIY